MLTATSRSAYVISLSPTQGEYAMNKTTKRRNKTSPMPIYAQIFMRSCAIIEALCSFWPIAEITVADRGIREGILLDLMHQNQKFPNKYQKRPKRRFPFGKAYKSSHKKIFNSKKTGTNHG